MNLANKLTISRIVMIPFILFFMLPDTFGKGTAFSNFVGSAPGRIIALILFIIAALTDMLDGMYARKQGAVSNFGKLFDPIADKLLVLSVFTAFVAIGRVSTFVVIILMTREFIVTGIRQVGAERGVVIAASWFGKVKTVAQILTLIALLFEPIIVQWLDRDQLFFGYGTPWTYVCDILIAVTVLLTLLSGLDYWLKNKRLLSDSVDVDV